MAMISTQFQPQWDEPLDRRLATIARAHQCEPESAQAFNILLGSLVGVADGSQSRKNAMNNKARVLGHRLAQRAAALGMRLEGGQFVSGE